MVENDYSFYYMSIARERRGIFVIIIKDVINWLLAIITNINNAVYYQIK